MLGLGEGYAHAEGLSGGHTIVGWQGSSGGQAKATACVGGVAVMAHIRGQGQAPGRRIRGRIRAVLGLGIGTEACRWG